MPNPELLLEVTGLRKQYTLPSSLLDWLRRRPPRTLRAVDGVDLAVQRGEALGLVGESGCGKTTLGRCLLRLIEPTGGSIRLAGQELRDLSHGDMRRVRRRVQMIFQDPGAALNPRQKIGAALAEVLSVHQIRPAAEIPARVAELLTMVGLPDDAAERYPRNFSGGQRQRIVIARALALEPDLLVADEPVSALDVSVQAQILNLLLDLRRRLGLTLIMVAHDLSVVRYVSTHVAVMYLGNIVEYGTTAALFERPLHPYTQALLLAVPSPDPRQHRPHIPLEGDPPSALNPPPGCRFHTRCPVADTRCRAELPPLRDLGGGHRVACHHAERIAWPPAPGG
jgi:oligopeptide/dipeptide ABC transporter ATP-binding protein